MSSFGRAVYRVVLSPLAVAVVSFIILYAIFLISSWVGHWMILGGFVLWVGAFMVTALGGMTALAAFALVPSFNKSSFWIAASPVVVFGIANVFAIFDWPLLGWYPARIWDSLDLASSLSSKAEGLVFGISSALSTLGGLSTFYGRRDVKFLT